MRVCQGGGGGRRERGCRALIRWRRRVTAFAAHSPPPVPPTPLQVRVIHAAAEAVFAAAGGTRVPYKVGTMIEVPRGALRAGDLAKHAQFSSFGTNDLTQVF